MGHQAAPLSPNTQRLLPSANSSASEGSYCELSVTRLPPAKEELRGGGAGASRTWPGGEASCVSLAWGRAKGRPRVGAIGLEKEHVLLENRGPQQRTPLNPLQGTTVLVTRDPPG